MGPVVVPAGPHHVSVQWSRSVAGLGILGALGLAGIIAGGIAAVAGFGIGSVLTPVLALETGTRLAVAAVAIPYVIGTALRLWILRAHVERRVLLGFGL